MKNGALKKTAIGSALAGALLILLAQPTKASQFQSFDRPAQVLGSDLILIGRVLSVHSQWDANHSAIYTEAELAIDEVWKGNPASDRVVVRTLGGTVDNVALEVDGTAEFATDEHVLVYLKYANDGSLTPWGMRYGKFDIYGSGSSAFAVGNLPPAVSGAQKFEQVSVPLDLLRTEVAALLNGGNS